MFFLYNSYKNSKNLAMLGLIAFSLLSLLGYGGRIVHIFFSGGGHGFSYHRNVRPHFPHQQSMAILRQTLSRWYPVCTDPKINGILNRADSYGTQSSKFQRLPWTLTSFCFHYFISEHTPSGDLKPVCDSIERVVQASSVHPLHQTCLIPWFSPDEIADTLRQYTRVVLLGDSLSRQIADGLLMMYNLDFELGSFPKDRVFSDEVFANCRCDGQFSESKLCRGAFNEVLYHYNLAPDIHLDYYFHYRPEAKIPLDSQHFLLDASNRRCPTLSKPIFLLLQGGSHFTTNALKTISNFIQPSMAEVEQLMKECSLHVRDRYKYFRFAYIGVPVISTAMEARYPHQDRINASIFNAQMRNYLYQSYPEVTYLDFWNITKDAEDRTSDGFHKLSDINMMQAVTLLNIMRESLL